MVAVLPKGSQHRPWNHTRLESYSYHQVDMQPQGSCESLWASVSSSLK